MLGRIPAVLFKPPHPIFTPVSASLPSTCILERGGGAGGEREDCIVLRLLLMCASMVGEAAKHGNVAVSSLCLGKGQQGGGWRVRQHYKVCVEGGGLLLTQPVCP